MLRDAAGSPTPAHAGTDLLRSQTAEDASHEPDIKQTGQSLAYAFAYCPYLRLLWYHIIQVSMERHSQSTSRASRLCNGQSVSTCGVTVTCTLALQRSSVAVAVAVASKNLPC